MQGRHAALNRSRLRGCLLVVLICAVPVAKADPGADLAQAKRNFEEIKRDVAPADVNRLDLKRRYLIWNDYYGLLEHLWRMEVHLEMMIRHGWDRRAEFDAARADFAATLESLRRHLAAVR